LIGPEDAAPAFDNPKSVGADFIKLRDRISQQTYFRIAKQASR
jgi:hypothetical protein